MWKWIKNISVVYQLKLWWYITHPPKKNLRLFCPPPPFLLPLVLHKAPLCLISRIKAALRPAYPLCTWTVSRTEISFTCFQLQHWGVGHTTSCIFERYIIVLFLVPYTFLCLPTFFCNKPKCFRYCDRKEKSKTKELFCSNWLFFIFFADLDTLSAFHILKSLSIAWEVFLQVNKKPICVTQYVLLILKFL